MVCRYKIWYSGVAYTAAKGISIEWCKQPDVGIPQPDLVIFFDADVQKLQSRGEFGEERYEKIEFQKKVRENFLKLKGDNWVTIDASKPIEEVTSDVQKAVKNFLDSHQ